MSGHKLAMELAQQLATSKLAYEGTVVELAPPPLSCCDHATLGGAHWPLPTTEKLAQMKQSVKDIRSKNDSLHSALGIHEEQIRMLQVPM